MEIQEALPLWVTLYRRGVLVPFIGAGMSKAEPGKKACRSWLPFLLELAKQAKVEVPDEIHKIQKRPHRRVDASPLYRLADRCVRSLQAHGWERFEQACRDALWEDDAHSPDVPAQTKALAELPWPLVLSTNYDDLLARAAQEKRAAAEKAGEPSSRLPPLFEIRGRSLGDCHAVLRSLDAVAPPILWALQGYLGAPELAGEGRAAVLGRQIVIGHRQYQTVINAQPHLRRAIAEVFRRRALLFLGSGVQEEYLVNLFSEIIHHHGPSSHPHFALFQDRERKRVDTLFFRTRLGIQPLFYSDHGVLPAVLDRLVEGARAKPPDGARASARQGATWMVNEIVFVQQADSDADTAALSVRFRFGSVPAPPSDGKRCSAASVGRQGSEPAVGEMARKLLARAGVPASRYRKWKQVEPQPFVYRHKDREDIFAIAARVPGRSDAATERRDKRDLLVIPDALEAFLAHVDRAGFEHASLGLLAAGNSRPWSALYPLLMMLTGIRRFAAKPRGSLREISISIVDLSVWLPLIAGKFAIESLLSSQLANVWLYVVGDAGAEPETYSLVCESSTTLRDLLELAGLGPGSWHVSLHPMPTARGGKIADWGDLPILPASTVTVRPARNGEDGSIIKIG